MTDYILFVIQPGCFQSRIMFVPANEYFSVTERKNEYDLLKKHSLKNYKISIDDTEYVIDNLLIHNLVDGPMNGKIYEKTEYTEICSKLESYADGMDDGCYFDINDKIWYNKAKILHNTGFNHIKNYAKYKNITKLKKKSVNIVDSFLVLDAINGVFELAPYDTYEEMLDDDY